MIARYFAEFAPPYPRRRRSGAAGVRRFDIQGDMDRRLRIAEVRFLSLEHDIDSMQVNECSILWYYQPRPFCLSPPS